MPIGYLITSLLLGGCTFVAVAPRRPIRSSPSNRTFWFAYLVNELPFLTAALVVANTLVAAASDDLGTPVGAAAAVVSAATLVGLVIVVGRALRTRRAVDRALLDAMPGAVRRTPSSREVRRWFRILAWPFPWWPRPNVRRVRGLSYGPDGRSHQLDLYRPRRSAPTGPILIHLHGGAFRSGRKSLDGQPLVNRLAANGWLCISANYRLGPDAPFPDQLIDVKRLISWVREHATELGGDPDAIVLVGCSAGGHLATTAALTSDVAQFQPGFEDADTSVRAVVSLYGYYGSIATRGPSSTPHDHVTAAAPPSFLAHGQLDTLVIVEDLRFFARRLGEVSLRPVVAAELPGGQHCFDLFHSIRCEALLDGIEDFLLAVLTTPAWRPRPATVRRHRS